MTLQEIADSIAHLPPEELSKFRDWFLEFDSKVWDDKIEGDVRSGRLDKLAESAIDEHRSGNSKPL